MIRILKFGDVPTEEIFRRSTATADAADAVKEIIAAVRGHDAANASTPAPTQDQETSEGTPPAEAVTPETHTLSLSELQDSNSEFGRAVGQPNALYVQMHQNNH